MTHFVRRTLCIFLFLAAGAPIVASAVVTTPPPPPPPPPPGPKTPEEVINVLNNFAPWLFGFLLALATLFLVIAAYNYLTAGEDTEKATTAKRMIFYTVIAVVAAAFARAIPALIQAVTGITADTPGSQVLVGNVAAKITNWLFGFLLVIAVAFIVYAAFLFLTSGGSEEKVVKARRFVFYAVIALVVGALSKTIVAIVKALVTGT